MCLTLLLLHKFNINGFIKVEDFLIRNGHKRCGDFSYLTHYKFLEKQISKRMDGSKRNGYYRITSLGILFAEGKTTAPSKFLILNNKFQGFEGEEVNIKQALGKKFNYDELMKGAKTDNEVVLIKQLSFL